MLARAARAVGRLSSPCTITHIGEGQGVTAAHCVPVSAITDCSALSVEWNDPDLPREAVRCTSVILHLFGGGADVAVLKFPRFPSTFLRIAWTLQTPPELAGAPLTVLSHSGGGGLAWSGSCGTLPHLGRRGPGGLAGTEFSHDCDTTSGSSGAALLDASTGDVVGIHSAGVSAGGATYNVATFARVLKGGVLLP